MSPMRTGPAADRGHRAAALRPPPGGVPAAGVPRGAVEIPATAAVNAAIVGERPTGLGVYAINAVKALDALGQPLVVYTSCAQAFASTRAECRAIWPAVRPERGALAHLLRLVWTQTALNVRLRRARSALLLNLMPEGLLAPVLPQVTVIHDVLPLLYPAEYPRQQYYFRHYVPAILRRSRLIVASSESTRRDLVRFYRLPPERVRCVPCGVDLTRFRPDPTPSILDPPYALYVGNVMPHKNLGRLVEAFARAGRGGRVRLVIVGSGRRAHTAALRQRLVELALESRVEWRAYATVEELVRLYRGARMLVLPSLSEGFGLTALEAMACGAPVISSRASALPEVVGEAALTVDPLDVDALAGAVGRLFEDEDLARELRARGLARAREFAWERTGRALQAVMAHVLHEA